MRIYLCVPLVTRSLVETDGGVQELYQQSMSLRPKVVKLIEKYNQKQSTSPLPVRVVEVG
jgi:hypothetical protein